jgi:hypothetical protein
MNATADTTQANRTSLFDTPGRIKFHEPEDQISVDSFDGIEAELAKLYRSLQAHQGGLSGEQGSRRPSVESAIDDLITWMANERGLSQNYCVCIHQTPPFQAILGRLPGTVVIAPQAPPVPNIDHWNWREYVNDLANFLVKRYSKRRIVATGFSRGGLGVLQLVSTYPELVQAWAIVDPQPARDQAETSAIFRSPAINANGWVRYGIFRNRDNAWKASSSLLFDQLPEGTCNAIDLSHAEMAVQAYHGNPLSGDGRKKNLYDHLGLKFEVAPLA